MLTDETLKPYMEKLAALEAKMNADREQMSTAERMDDNTAEITAHGDANTDKIIESVQQSFAKLAPSKFSRFSKWAYIVAKGSGAYYRTPDGTVHPRKGDIPPILGRVYIHPQSVY